ncbi:serpin-ZX-like [Rhododendron vialii]|uniref:serpin-ZX-like n=1 Tax=Rhododendron vialii TaxID=182163 RepID=UPI00265E0DD8|nr:serpin-ZX-like [Rhododendron vialii]
MEFCTRISSQLLLKQIDNDRNIVMSPLSINVVLNMVAAGSKGDGLEYMLRILGSKSIDEINSKSSEMMAVAAGDGSSNEAKDGPSSGGVDNRDFHPEDHGGLAGLPSPPTGNLGRPYQPFPAMGNLDRPYQPSPTGNSGWHYEPPFPPTGNLDWPYQPSRTGDSCWPNQFPYFPRIGNSDRPYQPSRTGNSYWPYHLPYSRRNWDWNYQPSRRGNSYWTYQPLSPPPPFPPTANSDRPYQRSQTGNSGFQSKQKTRNSSRRYQPFPPPVMPVAKGGGPSNNAEDGPTVVMVNGVWVDERFPLRPSYEELIRGVHKCEAKTVDFLHEVSEVVNEINSWANVVSRGLIKEILQHGSLNPDTAIVLANGLYFKGLWDGDYKFSHTEKRDFYLSNGNTILVPFMTSHKKYYFGSFDGFKVLKIPYQGRKLNKNFSMYFFLPNEKNGLKNLVEKFNTYPRFLQKNLNLRKVPLNEFWIPKFKF